MRNFVNQARCFTDGLGIERGGLARALGQRLEPMHERTVLAARVRSQWPVSLEDDAV